MVLYHNLKTTSYSLCFQLHESYVIQVWLCISVSLLADFTYHSRYVYSVVVVFDYYSSSIADTYTRPPFISSLFSEP